MVVAVVALFQECLVICSADEMMGQGVATRCGVFGNRSLRGLAVVFVLMLSHRVNAGVRCALLLKR